MKFFATHRRGAAIGDGTLHRGRRRRNGDSYPHIWCEWVELLTQRAQCSLRITLVWNDQWKSPALTLINWVGSMNLRNALWTSSGDAISMLCSNWASHV